MNLNLPDKVRLRQDKMGFVTPEDIWFRKEFKKQIYDIINSKSFRNRGFFDLDNLNKNLKMHMSGKINISFTIWRWINLELWLRKFFN